METSEHSESTNDEPAHARDLELVRSAQRGDSAPRAVLAGRLACVPLEVARRAGADPGDFRVEARAQLTWILEQLPQFDGSTSLEDWALERVRERLPAGPAAPDPEALAETVDVERLLDRDQLRLYQLIWKRTVACQMSAAVFDQVGVDIDVDALLARVTELMTELDETELSSDLEYKYKTGEQRIHVPTRNTEHECQKRAPNTTTELKYQVRIPITHS